MYYVNLIVANTSISQHNGLFSLNDLHKVSGGASKHQPSNFMRNAETQELIKEIELEKSNSSNLMSIAYTTTEGKKGGTFVCRELVIRYGMWISAKFSLMVIRAFDNLNTGRYFACPNCHQTIRYRSVTLSV
ncbi:KilA-N domain-containing protein [Moraxella sp. ZY200743]|uniref:KilA-N domain-containing protein n=1 Tax=Moraxella sp. ZY200743 TaxID=2911970 RepID=UPI003D7DFE23